MTVRPSDSVPSTLLQLTAGLLALAGASAVAVSMQFLLWWVMPPASVWAVYAMLAGGIATLVAAWFVSDGRPRAVVVGTLLAAGLTVGSTAWALWALSNLSFTLFMFVTPVLAAWSTVVVPLSFPAARRCSTARATLPRSPFSAA